MAEQIKDDQRLLERLRAILLDRALAGETITAEALAAEAEVDAARLPDLLETLIREDHAVGCPLLAALAVRGDQDSPITTRFFDVLRALGRYEGAAQGPEAGEWLTLEREDAITRHRAEQEAYAEMVYWMTDFFTGFGDEAVGHRCQSDFERMAWVLEDVGTIESVSNWGFRVVTTRQDARDRARRAYFCGVPGFQDVLAAYLGTACVYRSLTTSTLPGLLAREYVPAMDALCKLGYASKRGVYYCWTDAIMPAMIEARLWTDAPPPVLTPEEEKAQQRAAENASDAWRNNHLKLMAEMPETVKRKVLLHFKAGVPGDAIGYLYRCNWLEMPFNNMSNATWIVERMYADWLKENPLA